MKEIFESKKFKIIIYCVGVLVLILVVFQAGEFVGYKKAEFSYMWGNNYYQTFGNPHREPMMNSPMGDDFPTSHGAIGKIIKIELPSIIVLGPDNIEKIVLITDDTLINQFREKIKPENLKINDSIVVVGEPNSKSQIEAKLIRLIPTPPIMGTSTRNK
ncbi:MAG: hypothetical protein WCW87_02975 [Candidatus Paceibacterota bacterium]